MTCLIKVIHSYPVIWYKRLTGQLVPERDVEGLVKKVNWLIENKEECRMMLYIGREHIEKEYDARKQGLRLSELYKRF